MGYGCAPPITVDSIGDPENVTVSSPCRRVRVQQLSTESLVDFLCYGPHSSSYAKRRVAGSEHLFENLSGRLYQTGEVCGRIATVSGIATFEIEEES